MLITFTAYILIPVYTLLFVAGSDWFTTNFSVLGNIAGRNEAFVLWGLMVGIYFFVCLRKIFRRMPEKPAGTWLVPLALVLLDFAVTTPYLPEMFPLKAYLHIVFAFLAAACLILCVFLTVLKLYQRDPREYRPYLWGIGIIVAVSAFLFILAGIVSSALEIFFTVSMTWMVYGLYKNMTGGCRLIPIFSPDNKRMRQSAELLAFSGLWFSAGLSHSLFVSNFRT